MKKQKYLMTNNERIVFEQIKKNIKRKYVIFPQISIRSLIDRNYKPVTAIQWKIVDYLVCELPYYTPKLVIELNDITHEREDRKQRDKEVTNLLKEINLPIWFLRSDADYNRFNSNFSEQLNIMIDNYIP